MNVLFLTLLYHPSNVTETLRLSRDGMQNQINSHEWALVRGLRETLPGTLDVLNARPVGVFPTRYKRPWLGGARQEPHFRELGSLNLPYFKQRQRAKRFEKAMEEWIAASPDNRTILVYTLYLPFMQALRRVKARHGDVRSCCVVTDLPNELGIASYRHGALKTLEHRIGGQRMALCGVFDSYVLLTRAMAEALPARPFLVMEGLIAGEAPCPPTAQAAKRPTVLYTGTLNRELGIPELLQAFEAMPEYDLWLCGHGDMEDEIKRRASGCANIRYWGFVPQEQALALQGQAHALINPRMSSGVFTRYSFPSKTLEYLRAGKPVLCCKLPGIPDEYDDYLLYFASEDASGIQRAVGNLFSASADERARIGERGRAFALREKNERAQCERLTQFLHSLEALETL
ncbi:MAG: glycosyltransferase [Eubacteriales bacterium]|nr:glycosyltransferase [Eubacteriales bacterium]